MKIKNITLGADPELFIINNKTQQVVSAVGLIPGEKGNPYTEGMPKGFGVEIDCILGEFNSPPCTSKNDFVSSIEYMKGWIKNYLHRFNPDLEIACKATMVVPESELLDLSAHIIGCDRDFNAYTESANEKPDGYTDNRRVAGQMEA